LRNESDFRLADGSGKLAGEIVIEEASMRSSPMQLVLGTALLAAGGYTVCANAADKIDCEMRFSLSGWSAIYKHSEGSGVITCSNGKSYPVVITATGGGLTVGKQEIDDGLAKFSEVVRVSELFGGWAQGEATAGLVKGGQAQVMTKGNVSMALSGVGGGVSIGISFGKFTISPAKAKPEGQ
jgi:hypothetical protein